MRDAFGEANDVLGEAVLVDRGLDIGPEVGINSIEGALMISLFSGQSLAFFLLSPTLRTSGVH